MESVSQYSSGFSKNGGREVGEDGELGCEYSTCGGRGLRGECGIEMEGDDMVGAAAEI